MLTDPRPASLRASGKKAVQATLDTLLVQADEAIASANAAVTSALKRRDVGAARQALDAVHACSDFRETVLYVAGQWSKVQLPLAEARRSGAVRVQKSRGAHRGRVRRQQAQAAAR